MPRKTSRSPNRSKSRLSGRDAARGAAPSGKDYWLYGRHAVQAALANPNRRRKRLLLTAEAAKWLSHSFPKAADTPYEVADRDQLDDLTGGTTHQGAALLVAPLDQPDLEPLLASLPDGPARVVILDQVTDPQNIGAVMRSARAFGAAGVILPDRHAPEETAAMVKASGATFENLPMVQVVNLARAMDQLKEAGFWTVGLDGAADTYLHQIDLPERVALVMGSEGAGLRQRTAETCDFLAAIPISGAESLNVSAAAAVALYELARGRSDGAD